MGSVDEAYTSDDHSFRDDDQYAGAKYRWTLRKLGDSRKRRLLNVGCGAGLFNELAAARGFEVVAIEPDTSAFLIASKNAPQGVRVFNTGVFDLGNLGEFDVVVLHDVLEHIEDDRGAIEKINLLLRPGGVLIGSVPALQFLFGLHDERLGHFRRYRKKSLNEVISHRFDVKSVRYFGLSGIPFVWFYSCFRRRSYPVQQEASASGIRNKLFSVICRLEERIPAPVGTSILFECHVTRR